MRMVKLCSLFALPLCVAVGCGKIELVGGGNDGGGSNNDGGSNVDLTGSKIDMVGQPVAVAKATPVDQSTDVGAPVYLPLVGVGVKLEAAGSSDPKGMTLSYAWTVVSAPSGSTINTAALTNAATANASFIPDRGGDYQLQLVVTTSDSRTGTTNLTVTATTAPIFYEQLTATAGVSAGQVPTLIRSDGQGKKAVGCAQYAGQTLGSSALFNSYSALMHSRTGEPPRNPATGVVPMSRFLFSEVVPPDTDLGGDGLQWRFSIADETTDCDANKPKMVPTPDKGPPLGGVWSPDRSRFLYALLDDIDSSTQTISLALANDTMAVKLTGLESLKLAPVEPAWVDETTLLLVAVSAEGPPRQYQIYKARLTGTTASDVALWSDCSSVAASWGRLGGFEARGDSAYLGIAIPDPNDNLQGRGWDVWKFTPGSGTGCSPTNLTQSTEGGAARDFAVSADGKLLAYAKIETPRPLDMDIEGTSATDIWLLDTASPVSAHKLVGEAGRVEYGPRFIAGGRQLVYFAGPPEEMFGSPPDMGSLSFSWNGISVVNLDGSNARGLVSGSATVEGDGPPATVDTPILGGNYTLVSLFNGCAVDPLAHPLSSVVTGLLFAGALAIGIRRRRRS